MKEDKDLTFRGKKKNALGLRSLTLCKVIQGILIIKLFCAKFYTNSCKFVFGKEENKPGKSGNFVGILTDDEAEETSSEFFSKRFSSYVQPQSLFCRRIYI